MPATIDAVTTAANDGIPKALTMSFTIALGENLSPTSGCGRVFISLWVPSAEAHTQNHDEKPCQSE